MRFKLAGGIESPGAAVFFTNDIVARFFEVQLKQASDGRLVVHDKNSFWLHRLSGVGFESERVFVSFVAGGEIDEAAVEFDDFFEDRKSKSWIFGFTRRRGGGVCRRGRGILDFNNNGCIALF